MRQSCQSALRADEPKAEFKRSSVLSNVRPLVQKKIFFTHRAFVGCSRRTAGGRQTTGLPGNKQLKTASNHPSLRGAKAQTGGVSITLKPHNIEMKMKTKNALCGLMSGLREHAGRSLHNRHNQLMKVYR